ncbi:MAG: SLBB domain-containing protein, partial [Terracidiphilus sp.]
MPPIPAHIRRRIRSLANCVLPVALWSTTLGPMLLPGDLSGQATTTTASGGATASSGQVMSADAIINLLNQQPTLLREIRNAAAQKLGVDPSSITDQALFDRIRQDASLRDRITQELKKRGYNTGNLSAQPSGSTAMGAQASGGTALGGATSLTPQATGLLAAVGNPAPTGNTGALYPEQAAASQAPLTAGPSTVVCLPMAAGQAQFPVVAQPPASAQMQSGSAQTPASMSGVQTSACPPGTTAVPQPPSQLEPAQPLTQQRLMPYVNLPSLDDLYTQMLPPDTNLKRFGSDVFTLGTGNADALPMDLPAGPDYVLGPGDELAINISGSQPQTLSELVDRQGKVALPEVGTVTVAGLSIAQGQEAIRIALQTQYRNAHVEISLGRVHTVRVYVVGDVQRPGAYDISSLSTPLNALYAAGGPTSIGSLRILRHLRGDKLVKEIDLYDFLLKGVRDSDERLLAGDTILVPPVGGQVKVSGMVRRPAMYELKGNETLLDMVEMAGGVTVTANLKRIEVERVEANERRTMMSVELPSSQSAQSKESRSDYSQAMAKLAEFPARDGDSVVFLPILPYNEMAVYLDGHVFRPGKYSYREGMTINDLLHSYQDVMPEPADHAEIIRLEAPDYRPVTIGLNLPDVLAGNNPVPLKPFDVVRVFSRYEVDVPNVTINGEVLRPGDYAFSKGMTAASLLAMAGGFRRSAYRNTADLASYSVQNNEKVLIEHSTVQLERVVAGDRTADVELKPGDVLSVRQLTGWTEIGSGVTVAGQVGHPGVYGISEGEKLSSVLKRAGGLRTLAYAQGAILERVQVRELGEKVRQDLISKIQSEDITKMTSASSNSAQEQLEELQTMRPQQQSALTALQ